MTKLYNNSPLECSINDENTPMQMGRCSQNTKVSSAMSMAQANFWRWVLLYTFSTGMSHFLHLEVETGKSCVNSVHASVQCLCRYLFVHASVCAFVCTAECTMTLRSVGQGSSAWKCPKQSPCSLPNVQRHGHVTYM